MDVYAPENFENLYEFLLFLCLYKINLLRLCYREMYPNRILEKKMGRFRTVSTAPSLGKRWTPSSTHTGKIHYGTA